MKLHARLLAILLALDLFFIAVTGLCGVAVMKGYLSATPDFLNIGRDWSAGECLNYVKWAIMAVVLVVAWRRNGHRIHLSLAFFVLLVLADDSLQFHERGAELLVSTFPILRNQVGFLYEIVIWATMGVVGLTAVIIGLRDAPRSERDKVRVAAILFAAVVFFGMLVDVAHAFADPRSLVSGLLLLLEDGGEMISISVLAAYVVAVFKPAQVGASARFRGHEVQRI
ncbi:hypothetical protein [uncultured Jannaschia sp.]|uniref:hypothetical protein n=1 Tax=uncultured Jannaschia sp. TaxID=293347 RepID=UPI0026308201|nr:hypothetical protein [uncultured Jannaschia sp.]